MQNLTLPLPLAVPHAEGVPSGSPDDLAGLQYSLGLAAAACRTAVLKIRSPGEILAKLVGMALTLFPEQCSRSGGGWHTHMPPADLLQTNWNE